MGTSTIAIYTAWSAVAMSGLTVSLLLIAGFTLVVITLRVIEKH